MAIKLLVVEDESIVALDIKHRAELLGYKVVGIASSGEEALKLTKEKKPDLVLMDIVLKGEMDGIEAAEIIKRDYDIPVVYLTAHSDKETLERAKLTEPFGYLIKPFEDRELHSVIEVAIYKHMMDSKLRMSEKRYRKLAESSPDLIMLLDRNERIVFLNNAFERVTGFPKKECYKRHVKILEEIGIITKGEFEKLTNELIKPFKDRLDNPVQVKIKDNDGKEHYLELYASTIKNGENFIQIIGHDITAKMEADKRRLKLIREKTRRELYGFLLSAIPIFASTIPPQLRNTIIKSFGDKFEKNLKPSFNEHMKRKGLLSQIKTGKIEDAKKIFEAYISWLESFLKNLGIKTRIRKENQYKFEFVTFPWDDHINPIFSLMFRTIIMRSFTWTKLEGNVIQTSRKKKLEFEFHIEGGA
ncbi:MAG: methanogen output domain 1-containing protein [Methanothermobacter sp.]|nr:methanogen output domain 1-containing protein [Methanothermobacter sp.]